MKQETNLDLDQQINPFDADINQASESLKSLHMVELDT